MRQFGLAVTPRKREDEDKLGLRRRASLLSSRRHACPEPHVREAEAFLREIVSRLESILPDSIPVPDVSGHEYSLFNGTLSPLHLTDVNVIVEEATCQERERHFPFTISVSR
ncbi:hypothetical protein HPB52_009815 [Rhipicephalus sanguineus]|uniref:Uncharacterized protein n=1 Tax=Rhipicephalus sanguineus TaxID=34632 RepID=A0A9D4SQK0_RHISA|nr:hypothetical protein HPB52_009815 [Rhipicephalus sanguineus]